MYNIHQEFVLHHNKQLYIKGKGNNMKKIWPWLLFWLLLLLLLIIFCVWSKKDSIHVSSEASTPAATNPIIAAEKHYMDYTITQKNDSYTLEGSFTNTQQQSLLSNTVLDASSNLTISNTSADKTLLGEEAISLTNKILPHFIKNYKNAKIVYTANTLRVYGDVSNYEAKREMQNLLNTSTLASQDNTNVIMEKPIQFSITKTLEKVDFIGTFNTVDQGEVLRAKLPTSTTIQVSQSPHLVDKGSITFTENILPSFIEKYKNGKIEYNNEVLSVSGMVETEKDLEDMKKLLSHSTLTIINHTKIDQEAIAKAAANEEATRKVEAEAARQAKIVAEEKAAKLKAEEKAKLAEEATNEEATRKAEAARQAKIAAEEKVAKLKAEEKAKLAERTKLAKAQAAAKSTKEKITKLLQIENIEFKVSKDSLTSKGKTTVDKLATILAEHPNIKVEIAGHTDSDGSAIFNQKLSQARVDTAKARLIEKGIDPTRLTARGYGESKPLAPNTSDENKQKNRRVEINIQGE